MLQVQTLFFSPGIWVVCSRPLKNDEQAVQHYYLKNDRQAVEHYQRTADAGRLSRTSIWSVWERTPGLQRKPDSRTSMLSGDDVTHGAASAV